MEKQKRIIGASSHLSSLYRSRGQRYSFLFPDSSPTHRVDQHAPSQVLGLSSWRQKCLFLLLLHCLFTRWGGSGAMLVSGGRSVPLDNLGESPRPSVGVVHTCVPHATS